MTICGSMAWPAAMEVASCLKTRGVPSNVETGNAFKLDCVLVAKYIMGTMYTQYSDVNANHVYSAKKVQLQSADWE